MGAYTDHKFRRGFLLDEVRLRKIASIITNHIVSKPNATWQWQYKVKRSDALVYTTSSIEDIFAEDNSLSQRIVSIDITLMPESDKSFSLSLLFDTDEGTRLTLEGEDRNFVFVLF